MKKTLEEQKERFLQIIEQTSPTESEVYIEERGKWFHAKLDYKYKYIILFTDKTLESMILIDITGMFPKIKERVSDDWKFFKKEMIKYFAENNPSH